MKGYLLLENGLTYDCTVTGDYKNVLGSLTKKGNGVSIRCTSSGKDALISPESETISIEAKDAESLMEQITYGLKGKVIVDQLPTEYHLYDLKSDFH